ncbi:hypothetical protein RMATCC62417_18004 [Rhizopus microsporus]|nr:hypothetical protein RMATCC62417_18004 [Rhizopus microsporus]
MQIKLVILTICASLVTIDFTAPSPQAPPPVKHQAVDVSADSLFPPPAQPAVDVSAGSLFPPPVESDLQAIEPAAIPPFDDQALKPFGPSEDNGMPPDAAGSQDVGSIED